MRLAFSTLACPGWTLEEAAEAANRYGYEGLELRLFDGDLLSADLSDHQRARARRVCAEAGLEVCCLDTSFEVAHPDASIDEGYAYLDLAAAVGSPMIRVFGGAPDREELRASAQRAATRIAALAQRGMELGVRVALETHDSFATGESTATVLAGVPHKYAGALWDTLNPFAAGEAAERTLQAIGDRLLHIHVKDGGLEPDPAECRLLGEGRVPVRWILGALASRGYAGWLSVEWEKHWQPQIPGPDVALPQYADALRIYVERETGPT